MSGSGKANVAHLATDGKTALATLVDGEVLVAEASAPHLLQALGNGHVDAEAEGDRRGAVGGVENIRQELVEAGILKSLEVEGRCVAQLVFQGSLEEALDLVRVGP